jgi:hypothetical protein
MMIRETLQKNKRAATAAGAGLVALGIAAIIWANSGNNIPGPQKLAYYSDDDGKTFFADDFDRIFPFDHNGKLAYRATVCQCGGGKPFVAYLLRYSESAKSQLTGLSGRANDAEADALRAYLHANGTEMRRPGDTKWISQNGPGSADALTIKCPDGGSGVVREIAP